MPRISRKSLSTSFFHIITQGIDRNYIFEESVDIKYYIKEMYKLKEVYKLTIIAYCIMNNHAHILLKCEDLNDLSKYMQRLNTKYAIYYNRKYNRVGYVFRDRYKAEGIYDEKHLYNCIIYIYNNPVKAGICDKPEKYPYSNCKKMSTTSVDSKYVFMDVEEDKKIICEKAMNDFFQDNNITLIELKTDKIKLKKLIVILRESFNLSFIQISKKIGLGKDTIRKIYNSSN